LNESVSGEADAPCVPLSDAAPVESGRRASHFQLPKKMNEIKASQATASAPAISFSNVERIPRPAPKGFLQVLASFLQITCEFLASLWTKTFETPLAHSGKHCVGTCLLKPGQF
jgi:hypothetical protein